jgi:hypothetical protein
MCNRMPPVAGVDSRLLPTSADKGGGHADRACRRTVAEVAREVLAGVPLPSAPAEGTQATREFAIIAYQQAASLHERLATLYEQLGYPDQARQEWQSPPRRELGPSGPRASRTDTTLDSPGPDSGRLTAWTSTERYCSCSCERDG